MEKNNMTAVEWLQNELVGLDTAFSYCTFNDKLKQAKQMEKEQITDAYIMGSYDMASKEFKPEQYYNETYGKTDSNTRND